MRNPWRWPISLAAAFAVATSALLAPAGATGDPRDPVDVDAGLAEVPLGASVALVQKRVGDRIRAREEAVIARQQDPVVRDRMRRELPDRVRKVTDRIIHFTGTSEYDISLIAGEYAHNAGESMLHEPRGATDAYYFFDNGRLWKIIQTIEPHHDFATSAMRLAQSHGPAAHIDYRGGDESAPAVRLRWDLDEETVLLFADRRVDFGCYTLTRASAKAWHAHHDSIPDGTRAAQKLDPMVRDVLSSGQGEDVSDIVDRILQGD